MFFAGPDRGKKKLQEAAICCGVRSSSAEKKRGEKNSQRSTPSSYTKTKAPAFAGAFVLETIGSVQCSAEIDPACAKVFTPGKNAYTE